MTPTMAGPPAGRATKDSSGASAVLTLMVRGAAASSEVQPASERTQTPSKDATNILPDRHGPVAGTARLLSLGKTSNVTPVDRYRSALHQPRQRDQHRAAIMLNDRL